VGAFVRPAIERRHHVPEVGTEGEGAQVSGRDFIALPEREKDHRFDELRRIGCIPCLMNPDLGFLPTSLPVQIHHVNEAGHGTPRIGDAWTLGACWWHHIGSFNALAAPGGHAGSEWMAEQALEFGPSWVMGSKLFIPVYGNWLDMLELVNPHIRPLEAIHV
jgi:hypothetical protein